MSRTTQAEKPAKYGKELPKVEFTDEQRSELRSCLKKKLKDEAEIESVINALLLECQTLKENFDFYENLPPTEAVSESLKDFCDSSTNLANALRVMDKVAQAKLKGLFAAVGIERRDLCYLLYSINNFVSEQMESSGFMPKLSPAKHNYIERINGVLTRFDVNFRVSRDKDSSFFKIARECFISIGIPRSKGPARAIRVYKDRQKEQLTGNK